MKLEEATILALQGKLLENKLDENGNVKEDLDKARITKGKAKSDKKTEATKLEETDATPEFMEDLKNLINNYMRVDKIASIELQHRDESDVDIVVITFENGSVVRENVTGDSNLAMARSILFRLA